MSDPHMTCDTCGRSRNCLLHRRADHPPTAARQWLKRHCPHEGAHCALRYQAGIELGLSLEGQARVPGREDALRSAP